MNKLSHATAVTVAGCLTATLAVYVWLASAGYWNHLPHYSNMIHDQASAFLAGQLHLLRNPSPELLAAPNPFDPSLVHLWIWDAMLYKGKFYIYWGPVPPFIAAATYKLFSVSSINDAVWSFAYLVGRLLAGTGVLVLVWKHLAHTPPRWMLALGILVIGFAAPIPSMLTRGAIYEVAIAAAQFFIAVSLLFATLALVQRHADRRAYMYLTLSGCALGLALGSRASHLFAVVFFSVVTAGVFTYRHRQRLEIRGLMWSGVALLGPVMCAVLGLAIYNWVRFDSPFEYGAKYHLSYSPAQVGSKYVLYNIWTYLTRPLQFSETFPFVDVPWVNIHAVKTLFPLPEPYFYSGEPVPGALYVYPFFFLGILLACWYAYQSWSQWRFRINQWSLPRERHIEAWILLVGLGCAVLSMVPVLMMFCSIMRYLADMILMISLAVMIAYALFYGDLSRHRWAQRSFTILMVVFAVWSLGVSILISINGQNRFFVDRNPVLFAKMVAFFQL